MDEKKCTKCGETKPLDEFNRDSARPDGRRSRCKACAKVDGRERYARNPEARRESSRRYYESNTDKCHERDVRYRRENREKVLAREARYRERNREARAAYMREWHASNPEWQANYYAANADRIKEYGKSHRAKMRDSISERMRAYRADNPHIGWASSYRSRCRAFATPPVVEDFTKADVIERYGDSCAYCEAGEFEQLDHFVPVKDGGPHTLANVRPSCAACNLTKKDADPDEWLAEQAELDDLTEDELDDLIDAEIERWTK